MATVIFGIGLLIGSVVHVSQPAQVARQSILPSTGTDRRLVGRGAGGEGGDNVAHSRPTVGRITGMVDCRWEGKKGDSPPLCEAPEGPFRQRGTVPLFPLVTLGDRFALASGLMEITYDTGAKVILQGPVTYEVESASGGYLSVGKLTARVESAKQQAAISKSPNFQISKLFLVKTPTATVTDLGTEFGVEVEKRGSTVSHVFRGSVRLEATSADGRVQGMVRVLNENESAQVANHDGNRVVLLKAPVRVSCFVREMPRREIKTLDLVDVVAGGDGYSGRRNHGINVTNGRPTDKQPPGESYSLVGDGKYHRVEELPFVDGVFVPDGRTGRVQIDSAGHIFDGFPASPPLTGLHVWAGGEIPDSPNGKKTGVSFSAKLADIDYSSSGHGVLWLHANKGITFDLEAIRRANPGSKLVRFCAVAGDCETDPATTHLADIWVFVDGHVRFSAGRSIATAARFWSCFPSARTTVS